MAGIVVGIKTHRCATMCALYIRPSVITVCMLHDITTNE